MIFLVLILVLVAILTINTVNAKKKARTLSEFKPFYNEKEIEYYVKYHVQINNVYSEYSVPSVLYGK